MKDKAYIKKINTEGPKQQKPYDIKNKDASPKRKRKRKKERKEFMKRLKDDLLKRKDIFPFYKTNHKKNTKRKKNIPNKNK